MAESVSVKLDMRKLEAYARRLDTNADNAVGKMAFAVQADAQSSFGISPSQPGEPPGVDTGALRASVHTVHVSRLVWRVSDGVLYGAFLEFGTPVMGARPWLRPALLRLRGKAPVYFRELFK